MKANTKQTGIAKFFSKTGKDASNLGATPQNTWNTTSDRAHASSQRRLTGLKRAWELENVRLPFQ